MKTLDLNDAASPELVSGMLREAAQQYVDDAYRLQSDWGDANAGRVWIEIARALDAAADRADKACAKYFV